MIIGLGSDIVSVKRIRKILEENRDSFLKRILSPGELEFFSNTAITPEFLAGRWAAKEACAKALGCGFGKDCAIGDITILREKSSHASGRPLLTLSGAGKKKAESLGVRNIHVSISHEKEFAFATVLLEG